MKELFVKVCVCSKSVILRYMEFIDYVFLCKYSICMPLICDARALYKCDVFRYVIHEIHNGVHFTYTP